MFEGLKIPRVNAPLQAPPSSSGSEGQLIPSDYPSESQSDDARSLPPSSGGSFENQAFIQDTSSFYSEVEQPKFDVQVRVKRAPPSPPSLSLSDSDRTERELSTILEQREESVSSPIEKTQFTYVPELHPPPKHIQPAPTYTRILRRQQELQEFEKITAPPPPPIIPIRQEVVEAPIAAIHKPEITSHVVDDVFLRTITEKKTIEDIERHKRLITEYHTKPIQDWDVTIKNYPIERAEPEWENFSDISSASGLTQPAIPREIPQIPTNIIDDNKLPLNSPELVGTLNSFTSTYNIPLENPQVPNWNVLIRVLQPQEHEEVIESAETFNSQLTTTDKMKWRQIITTESTLRTLLTEAVVREDFERIRMNYSTLFEPQKWDVIIRILSPVDRPKRFRKKSDFDTRSRRSSLPTLYEYDSDGIAQEPIVKSTRKTSSYRSEADLRSMSEMTVDFRRPDQDSETSSYYPGRYYEDSEIEYKTQHSLARSLSQPSLARSASEFTERWVAPSIRYDTASEFTSPEVTPKSQRSTRIQPLHVPRGVVWETSTSQVAQRPSTSHQIVQEFHGEQSTSFMTSSSNKNWFGDNDSETSFK